ncbi:hypothetical protein ElyMa_002037000 [Elysia marginata]|uniref:Uncharacterized protein n=1 Tax=Elysia marginata TaxID=1093978 RepID=A0AAV4F7M5_9GAST|nr:hypothetical protein ElyMa_002037000 [Elysia marginata]
MDPHRPDCRRSPLARSPTLRPDPRHQRSDDSTHDTVIKLIRDIQRPGEDVFYTPQNIQGSRSPIVCKRKAVLPAIGASVVITETNDDKGDKEVSFRSHSNLFINPPTIVEPNDPNNENFGTARPSESDEASPSTSTADSGFAEKEPENLIESGEACKDRLVYKKQVKTFNEPGSSYNESNEASYNENYNGHTRLSNEDMHYEMDPDFDDSEYFPELQKRNLKKKNRTRLEVNQSDARTRSRQASRNSVCMQDEEEARFGDDSMLKPVSHQSVVAEDKLVSSRCRRSSKLLDKLMLSEYNSGQGTASPFLLQTSCSKSSTTNKGYQTKSFRSLSNTLSMAGQIMRPRTLPHLPPILKRQKTVDIPEEEHVTSLQQSIGWERPSAPSPSLTPPSPSDSERSDCDDPDVEEDPNFDFIDCR